MIGGLVFAALLSVTPNAVTATVGAARPTYAFIKLVGESDPLSFEGSSCREIAYVKHGQGVGVNNSYRLTLEVTGHRPGRCAYHITSGSQRAVLDITVIRP
jgi:hypothetical protein